MSVAKRMDRQGFIEHDKGIIAASQGSGYEMTTPLMAGLIDHSNRAMPENLGQRTLMIRRFE
jgi:hypothetical protein